MVLRKVLFEGDGWSFFFLVFVFTLTAFSLFYADWHQKNMIGFVTDGGGDDAPPPPPPPKDGGAEDIGGGGSNGGSGGSGDSSATINSVVVAAEVAATTAKDLTTKALASIPSVYIVSSAGTGTPLEEPILGNSFEDPLTIGPPSTTACSGGLLTCQSQLAHANQGVITAVKDIKDLYQKVLTDEKKYPRSKEIKKSRTQIENYLTLMLNLANSISQQLSYTSVQIAERNIRVAQNQIVYEEDVQEDITFVAEYVDKYESYVPPAPVEDPFTEIPLTECGVPADLIVLDVVNIGDTGLGNGDICQQDIPKPKPIIFSSSTGSPRPFPTINIPIPGVITSAPLTGGSSAGPFQGVAFIFESPQTSVGENVEAFAAVLNPTGQFILGFFSSPSVGNIADEINAFVQKITLGLHDEVFETKIASAEILAMDLGRKTPWTLWIVLVVVVVPFLFFGKYLLPTHERLIFEGRRAISKNDFGKSVAKYKELIIRYKDLCEDNGADVRQEILEYFILLHAILKAKNVKFTTMDGGSKFLDIVLAKNSLTEFQRVEMVLHDALHDLKSDRKKAVLRAPTIAKMYSQLDKREKEKLASLYERFVYSMRKV